MGNELVQLPAHGPKLQTLDDFVKLGDLLAKSGFFSDARSGAQAVVKILAGAELGFGPLASLTGVHIVEGKPCPGSHLLAAAIHRSGRYDYRIAEHTDERCSVEFLALRDGKWVGLGTETLTIAEARAKGWTTTSSGKPKPTWEKTPKNMLFARVMSNGYKFHCPDLSGGVVTYDADEIDVEVIEARPDPPQQTPAGKPAHSLAGTIDRDQQNEIAALLHSLNPPRTRELRERYQIADLHELPTEHFEDCKRWLVQAGAYPMNGDAGNAQATPEDPPVTREQVMSLGMTKDQLAEWLPVVGVERFGHLPASLFPILEKAVKDGMSPANFLAMCGKPLASLDPFGRQIARTRVGV